jgi:hypothetical protein
MWKRLKNKLRAWLLGDLLERCNESSSRCRQVARAASERLGQLNALSAVDLPMCRDAGLIIVVANVQGHPRLHLSYIQPEVPMSMWRDWQVKLEEDFGARTEWIDAPRHIRELAHAVLREC